MDHFARVVSGVVAEIASLPIGDLPSKYFPESLLGNWTPCDASVVSGDTFNGTTFSAAVASASTTWATYQASAQLALDKSDRTVLRCIENGVTVPATWATYRKDLRAIISAASGDPTQSLPTQPSYPTGT